MDEQPADGVESLPAQFRKDAADVRGISQRLRMVGTIHHQRGPAEFTPRGAAEEGGALRVQTAERAVRVGGVQGARGKIMSVLFQRINDPLFDTRAFAGLVMF